MGRRITIGILSLIWALVIIGMARPQDMITLIIFLICGFIMTNWFLCWLWPSKSKKKKKDNG